jgi:hypothetical protein
MEMRTSECGESHRIATDLPIYSNFLVSGPALIQEIPVLKGTQTYHLKAGTPAPVQSAGSANRANFTRVEFNEHFRLMNRGDPSHRFCTWKYRRKHHRRRRS